MPTTRFAPSPTGLLHIGHAFSALFAQRAAQGCRFVLRIEDIDQTRCRPEFIEAIYEDLAWLGLEWERPVRVQSEHFDLYMSSLLRLDEMGLTYLCFCTRADIQHALGAPHGPEGPVYPGTCRALSKSEQEDRIASGQAFAVRLRMDDAAQMGGALSWRDHERGGQTARPQDFGDVVLARKETPASYHLCVVVDDAKQGIEIVTRGDDLFRATDVQRLLQSLLGLPEPTYWHHRLILGPDGKKFSKRDAAVTLRSLRESGTSPSELYAQLGFRQDRGASANRGAS